MGYASVLEPERLCQAAVQTCHELMTHQANSSWIEWSEDSLWFELVTCILGSRVPYELALAAAERLRSSGLLDTFRYRGALDRFEGKLMYTLSTAKLAVEADGRRQRYRFPYSRARYIRQTLEAIRAQGGSLLALLATADDAFTVRRRIVALATGVGPKQASLFLRNIGYDTDLAVLDAHVLRYMVRMKMVPAQSAKVHALARYERIEEVFRAHAVSLGFPAGLFDAAVWVVMRVAQG